MRKPFLYAAACLTVFILIFSGCGSGNYMRGRKARTYQARIGTGTPADIIEKVNRRLNLYGYAMARFHDDPHQIYFETNWLYRSPSSKEMDQGIINVRTRLILTTTHRSRGEINIQALRMVGEVQIQLRETEEWINPEIDSEMEAYFNGFKNEVARDLNTGVGKT